MLLLVIRIAHHYSIPFFQINCPGLWDKNQAAGTTWPYICRRGIRKLFTGWLWNDITSSCLPLYYQLLLAIRLVCRCFMDFISRSSGHHPRYFDIIWVKTVNPMFIVKRLILHGSRLLINFAGRMALLVTLFLVLVNIFNTVTTNTPKAEGE